MSTTTLNGDTKRISVHDYPEHLNPFHEDDNHTKIRFWTLSRPRRNSFSLNNFKDIRNTWSLKSFMKKGKKGGSKTDLNYTVPIVEKKVESGESPILFRRALEYSSFRTTVPGVQSDRYVYGGSVTPLPATRFQKRLHCGSQHEVNGTLTGSTEHQSLQHRATIGSYNQSLSRNTLNTSTLSVQSTNPFDDNGPVRASRRKKKRAPLPPIMNGSATNGSMAKSFTTNNISINSSTISETISPNDESIDKDLTIDDPTLKIELKIVEDEDHNTKTTKNDTQAVEIKDDTNNNIKSDNENNVIIAKRVDTITVQAEVATNGHANIEDDRSSQENTDANGTNNNQSKKLALAKSEEELESTEKLALNNTVEQVKSTENIVLNGTIKSENVIKPESQPNEVRMEIDSKDGEENKKVKQNGGYILEKVDDIFKKVNIKQYRRNNSFSSESDYKNNKMNDFANKRSKSMFNGSVSFDSFDVELHIDEDSDKDVNDNKTNPPQKVVCKIYDNSLPRKASVDASISSTEREFQEIDRATKELEMEISKLNSNLYKIDDEKFIPNGRSVASIRQMFDNNNSELNEPNPIPKPRRTKLQSPLRMRK